MNMEKFNDLYSPFRERVGDYGVIVTGVAVIAVSFFVRTDIFEAILDFIGILGMIAGAAIAAIGIFMLGNEKGWWDKIIGPRDGRVGGGPPSSGVAGQPPASGAAGQPPVSGAAGQPPIAETRASTLPEAAAPAPQPQVIETSSQTVGPAPQPDNPTMYAAAAPIGPAHAYTARPTSFWQLPSWIVFLAILPAALLLLSVLPVTPWMSVEVGGRGGEPDTDSLSLWEVVTYLREVEGRGGWGRLNTNWEEGLVPYVVAIIGTVVNGVFCLWWFMGAERRSEAEARDSLELLLGSSILICTFTSITLLYALFATSMSIWIGITTDPSPSLGGYLSALSLLSLVGYLIVLIANGVSRGSFSDMSLSTFFSFSGRTTRLYAALVLTVSLVLFTLRIMSVVYADDLYITQLYFRWAQVISIFELLFIWVWLSVCIKRYHDRNKAAWWVLLIGVSQIVTGLVVTLVKESMIHLLVEHPILTVVMVAASLVFPVAVMFELLFLKGTPGENRYGPPVHER